METFLCCEARELTNQQRNEFYQLRKRQFVDDLGWRLNVNDGLETDQYDCDDATYSLLYHHHKLVAGLRLLRTDRDDGNWCYMIRDANDGRLAGLASQLLDNCPQAPQCVEITRLCADPELPARLRNQFLTKLANRTFCTLVDHGIREAIAMVDPRFKSWLNQRGFNANVISDTYHYPQGKYAILYGALAAAQAAA